MSKSKLKIGDVVVLKSGGPKMTVSKLDGDEDCSCIWFAGDDLQDQDFPNETLDLAT